MGEPQTFQAVPLAAASLSAPDRAAVLAFAARVSRLQRAVLGASRLADDLRKQLALAKKAVDDTPKADATLADEVRLIDNRLQDIQVALGGDSVIRRYNEPTPPSIAERVGGIISGQWVTTSAPTETHRQQYAIAAEQFGPVLEQFRKLVEVDLEGAAGSPRGGRRPVDARARAAVDARTVGTVELRTENVELRT